MKPMKKIRVTYRHVGALKPMPYPLEDDMPAKKEEPLVEFTIEKLPQILPRNEWAVRMELAGKTAELCMCDSRFDAELLALWLQEASEVMKGSDKLRRMIFKKLEW